MFIYWKFVHIYKYLGPDKPSSVPFILFPEVSNRYVMKMRRAKKFSISYFIYSNSFFLIPAQMRQINVVHCSLLHSPKSRGDILI